MARMRTKRSGKKSKKNPPSPTMLLSKMLPEDLMGSAVLSFSDRASVASFMAVEDFSKVFRLRSCFCKDHGTQLGQVCKTLPASPNKQCADCEMPKIGMTRCGKCDVFSKRNHFGNCNDCEKTECNGCMFLCVQCCKEFCFKCKYFDHCEECKMSLCDQCAEMFVCTECTKTFCFDCKEYGWCEVCETIFCDECKDTFFCENCEAYPFCLECKKDMLLCNKCDETARTDCKVLDYCEVCQTEFCRECKGTFYCEECHKSSCLECKDVLVCEKCDKTFCEDTFCCKECNEWFCCLKCKDSFHCQECNKCFCGDCKDVLVCEECDEPFCIDCRASFSYSECESDFCLGCRKAISSNDECEHKCCCLRCKERYACCSPKGEMLYSETS